MLKKVNNKGFSIIEVLIVLAIAGLIMLVVFLAVPALRRNSANSGRQSDASRISTQIQDCLSNRNGVKTSCDTPAEIDVPADSLSQLTAAPVVATATAANGTIETITTVKAAVGLNAAGTATNNPDGNNSAIVFSAKCNGDGSDFTFSNNTRDFVVVYGKKTSSTTIPVCIGS